jgi:hypothetical protein
MNAKKFIIALVLLASASSAAFAKMPRYYDYSGGAAGDPVSSYASGQPGPNSGIEAVR